MGEEDNPQSLKRIAAAAHDYDYDNDPRWAEYWSNVLIPPRMASRSDVVDHFKLKFYQRYIDPDLVLEAMPSSSSSQSARPTPSSSSSNPNDQARQRNSGSTTRTSGPSTTAAPNPTSLRWDRHTIQFSINAWIPPGVVALKLVQYKMLLSTQHTYSVIPCWSSLLIFANFFFVEVFMVAVLAIFPLAPKNLSNRAYRLSLIGTACSSLYSLYSLYGKPRAWNLQAVQEWFQSVVATKDFIYFIYCLTFVTSHLHLRC
ncbi:hypothetical protein Acr_03g0015950 [Actinidia rufa]|uniref:Transmembrane protein n=1 Tax=Actinidia rufa TaxID=165716 RepID=A0A7J0EEB3_9ERIC|nr:hypothetical protein Acr_03g0015950 [Actinidia rufa]